MRLSEGGAGSGPAALGVAEHDYIYFTKLSGSGGAGGGGVIAFRSMG
jgi:hypothetical protein